MLLRVKNEQNIFTQISPFCINGKSAKVQMLVRLKLTKTILLNINYKISGENQWRTGRDSNPR